MPWATFETNGKYCVFALDADNNKKGEALECYPTRDAAQTYVKGLYSKDKTKALDELLEAFKVGRRNAGVDQADIQSIHDLTCKLDAKCKEQPRGGAFENTDKLAIFKDAQTGKYRWMSFSSSAFRDRDREIVSTKALTDDVARADSDGHYGPLRFWHEPGIDIGYTDFNAMEGRVLVESGGFNDERIGEALKEYQDELGLSIGFTHPADQPDASGTYHNIRRFERSIVPADKASNLLTQFIVKNTGDVMDATKKTLLEKLIGPDLAAKFIGQAKETEKAAEEAGMKFKGTADSGTLTGSISSTNVLTVKAEDEEKPADNAVTMDAVKALINKAFSEYEDKLSAKKAESDEATVKATNELTETLKAIQSGQSELKDAVVLALQGVAELNGTLPRKLGEQFKGFSPAANGKQPGSELQKSIDAFKAAQDELKAAQVSPASFAGDPLAPFMNAVLGGAQQQPYVNPNQPQGG